MSWLSRSRNRGTRPDLPSASPGSNIYPGVSQWGAIDLPNPSAATVKGLPAANRAVSLISNAVAQMAPMEMWTPDGFVSDITPNILARPNSVYTCFDFFQMVIEMAVMHGNFIGLLADWDATGYPQQIVPVPHGFALAYFDGAGYLVYAIGGETYSAEEVVHVRVNATPNQPMGTGVVTQFRRSLGQALDQQNFTADTYRSGSVPTGVINLDKDEVDVEQAEAVTTQWIANHAGGRAPAVLPNTMKFSPISWSPEDMQFLEARDFTVGEIAHMFNLDPTDLGAARPGSSETYANIEQRQAQRIVDTYAPWMLRLEQTWADLIPGGNVAKLCPDNLLRTDSKTRSEVQQLMIGNETLTVDEARATYGKKPLPKPKTPPALPPAAPGAVAPGAAPDQLNAGAPQPDPNDPNISQTPIKVKV